MKEVVYEALWDAGTTGSSEPLASKEEEKNDDDGSVEAEGELALDGDGDEESGALLGPASAPARPTISMPVCEGDMLRLAHEGEWGEVGGKLRWIVSSLPCVTPIATKEEVTRCLDDN